MRSRPRLADESSRANKQSSIEVLLRRCTQSMGASPNSALLDKSSPALSRPPPRPFPPPPRRVLAKSLQQPRHQHRRQSTTSSPLTGSDIPTDTERQSHFEQRVGAAAKQPLTPLGPGMRPHLQARAGLLAKQREDVEGMRFEQDGHFWDEDGHTKLLLRAGVAVREPRKGGEEGQPRLPGVMVVSASLCNEGCRPRDWCPQCPGRRRRGWLVAREHVEANRHVG